MGSFKGVGVSPGIGFGRSLRIEDQTAKESHRTTRDPAEEKARLDCAVERFVRLSLKREESAEALVGSEEASIFAGHAAIIIDPRMQEELTRSVDEGMDAETAVRLACDKFAAVLEATGDAIAMQRADDIRDVAAGVLAELSNAKALDFQALPPGSVLVSHTFTPSMAIRARSSIVAGVIAETGGYTGHSAILLRALGIPAVFSAQGACESIPEGKTVIFNGTTGLISVNPTESEISSFRESRAQIGKHPVRQGKLEGIRLRANISSPEEAARAIAQGADGVGLFRTEYLFMGRDNAPSEGFQFDSYRTAAIASPHQPTVIRTLDAGGEKHVPYLAAPEVLPESQPALRGVGLCLINEELFKTQLRAMLRASAYGDVRIMVPMVRSAQDMAEVRSLLSQCMDELDRKGISYNGAVKVGAMMETISSVEDASAIARQCDFLSIGTNDLTSAITHTSRNDGRDAIRLATCDPRVLHAVSNIIAAGLEAGITVGICGEAAANPSMAPLWMGMGIRNLSMNPSGIPAVHDALSRWTQQDAAILAQRVLELDRAEDIMSALAAAR